MNAIRKTKPEDERAAYVCDEQRWAAVQGRDARADGHFVYGVRTTGGVLPVVRGGERIGLELALHDAMQG